MYIAKKFENTGINIEDLISIGTIGLIKSINTFNTDKNIKLATYSSRCIENEILMYLRKNNNSKAEILNELNMNLVASAYFKGDLTKVPFLQENLKHMDIFRNY